MGVGSAAVDLDRYLRWAEKNGCRFEVSKLGDRCVLWGPHRRVVRMISSRLTWKLKADVYTGRGFSYPFVLPKRKKAVGKGGK